MTSTSRSWRLLLCYWFAECVPPLLYCSVQLLLDKPVDQLRNTFSNLALPLFTSAEPDPPKATKAKTNGKEWTWTAVGRDTVHVLYAV
jgi:hypothetical protein